MAATVSGYAVQMLTKQTHPAIFASSEGAVEQLCALVEEAMRDTIAVPLGKMATVATPCSVASLRATALRSAINRRWIAPQLELFKERNTWAHIVLVHVDASCGRAYVMAAGSIAPGAEGNIFKIADLAPNAQTHASADADEVVPSSPRSPGKVPLPLYLPSASAKFAGRGVTVARTSRLMLAFSDLLEGDQVPPVGEAWWEWAADMVGAVTVREEQWMLHYWVLLMCRRDKDLDDFVGRYRRLLMHCIDQDRTFAARAGEQFPVYKGLRGASVFAARAEHEIRAIAIGYRARYYGRDAPMANSLPFYIKQGLDSVGNA